MLKQTPGIEFVRYSLVMGAIEFIPEGRELKSGRISPYFFNSGLFNTGRSIDCLAEAYANALETPFGNQVEVVFGPAYKGIPLSVAVAMKIADSSERDVAYAFNRKEEKTHGDKGIIVGAPLYGRNVLIVDDVMTTGTSSGEAVETIRESGGIPIGCVISFDRQERGNDSRLSAVQEFEENYGIPVRAVATFADLIHVMQTYNYQLLSKVLAYREKYGVS